jgi:hypothetical protein
MDLIYKIEDWLIYDNFFNRECRFVASIVTRDYAITDLEYIIRCNKSIIIDNVNTSDLIYEPISKTHMPHYNGYSMKWNETKFGIDLTEYNTFYIQPIVNGEKKPYSSFNICKKSRIEQFRNINLSILLEE